MYRVGKLSASAIPLVLLGVGALSPFQSTTPVPSAREFAGGLKTLSLIAPGNGGIIFTQLPAKLPDVPLGEGARIIRLLPEGSLRALTSDFHSAADPDVSFDGERILFAGKRLASDLWQIYEMEADGSGVRQITREPGDCRSPIYQSTLYVITSDKPWYQIAFVGYRSGAPSLYSCRLDGSAVRRLTFNPYGDVDPFLMPDGRILFAGEQRYRPEPDSEDRVALFGVNLDGADYAIFAGDEGARIKRMPCATTGRLAVFVEPDGLTWDGAGALAAVSLRRNLHSHRALTKPSDGLFHSPSPLPGGDVLVSRRPADGTGTHGIYRFNPSTGKALCLYDDPHRHDIQAKILHPRPEPDGRSSVVDENEPTGRLYSLNVYVTDFQDPDWMPPGSVKRLRVLEGLMPAVSPRGGYPSGAGGDGGGGHVAIADSFPARLHSRFLGEIDVEEDGSFNIQVPADIPIQLQVLDADGMALRTCSWIWVKNREPRGCIGCHEDGELTPENRMVRAVTRMSIPLTLPPERRRAVEFPRDVMPILARKCGNEACHGDGVPPRLDSASGLEKLVDPGRARTSPLVWSLYGRDTTRPWDRVRPPAKILKMPPPDSPPLTEDEKRTIIEWIDLGAHFNEAAGYSSGSKTEERRPR